MRALIWFGLGWFFGRNPGAGQQVVASGRQILDTVSGTPVATNVLPDTTIAGPQCPPGYRFYSGGIVEAGCVSQAEYDVLMNGQRP